MNDAKVTMTIEKNGRWYRFVQIDNDVFFCARCCFVPKCFGDVGSCPIGYQSKGYFERFRPTDELVRVGVRILRHEARRAFPFAYITCRGPQYPTDGDNEILFHVHGTFRDDLPANLLALIDRLNALGLSI